MAVVTFKSKVDLWIGALLALLFLTPIANLVRGYVGLDLGDGGIRAAWFTVAVVTAPSSTRACRRRLGEMRSSNASSTPIAAMLCPVIASWFRCASGAQLAASRPRHQD